MAVKERAVRFTERELGILDLFPKDGGKITSRELMAKRWGDDPPKNGRVIVTNTLRAIAEKAEQANLPWRLRSSADHEGIAHGYWIALKPGRKSKSKVQ